MHKLLLMSVLLASVVIPIVNARDSRPRRSLERTLLWLFAFNLVYLLAAIVIYPRICW